MYRLRSRALFIKPDHIASVYHLQSSGKEDRTPEFQKDELITHTLIGNDGEVHVFWHNYPDPLYLSVGGYGISIPHNGTLQETPSGQRLCIQGGDYYSTIQAVFTPEGNLYSTLLTPRKGWEHTHLFGGLGAYCSWQSKAGVPPHTPVVVYVNGTKGRVPANVKINVTRTYNGLVITFEGKQYQIKIID